MGRSVRVLNLFFALAVGVLTTFALAAADDPEIEMTSILAALVLLLSNWWVAIARFTLRLRTARIVGFLASGLMILGSLSLIFLDEDDNELGFAVVGGGLLAEGIIAWGLWVGLRNASNATKQPLSPADGAKPNSPWWEPVKVFLKIQGGLVLVALLSRAMFAGGPASGLFGLFLLFLSGWAIYAFLQNRQSRQDELARLLDAGITAGVPIAPILRSYLRDRPARSKLRRYLAGTACLLLPVYAYVRIWIGWRRYDRLVKELAGRLETGETLSSALRAVPGVVTRQVRLAAALGETTGSLHGFLRGADREERSAAWLEIAPRIVYPFLVFNVVCGITVFLMMFVVPKYKRIFEDFGEPLPAETQLFIHVGMWANELSELLGSCILLGIIAVSIMVARPQLRWRMPVIGPLYRWGVQATVLRTLGRLLAVGRTVPQALDFLGDSAELGPILHDRLAFAAAGVERGHSLDDALRAAALLPPAMAPLVRLAERVGTLPGTLTELGDHLAGKAFRLARRISLIAGPLLVLAVGAIVGFIALSMFLPLIHLFTRLSE